MTARTRSEARLSPSNIALWAITALFILWGLGFIYRSSTAAIDGRRYFCLVDDAMISMRYAWNLTHGLGLVWNEGVRVEGYSNLLMVLWMAVATAILDKSNAVLMVQLSGIAMMLGTAWVTMRIARLTTPSAAASYAPLVEVLAFAAPLTYYPLVYWSLMGMETGLLALLLAWGILESLRYARTHGRRHLIFAAIALGMAYLTRNDSAIFAAIVFIFLLMNARRAGSIGVWPLTVPALIYAGLVAAQAAFRYGYYGSLFPNTYFLKLAGMPMRARLENGAGFLAPFLLEVAPLMVVTALAIVWRPSGHKLLLSALLIGSLAYELFAGGDYSNYWRIMAPVLPLWTVILAQSLVELALTRAAASPGRPGLMPIGEVPRMARPAVVVVLALVIVLTNRRFLGEVLLPRSLSDNSRDNVNLSVAIDAATKIGASVGVIRAGTIPYYTGRMAVDYLGKNDPQIANLPADLSGQISWNGMYSVPGHNKYDLEYSIKELLPTYSEGFEWGSQNLNDWAREHYVEVKYHGVRLDLLRGSPLVNWDEVQLMRRDQRSTAPSGN